MKIEWNPAKNQWLKQERGVSFEMVQAEIEAGRIVQDILHPKRNNQRLFVIRLNDYIYGVPYVFKDNEVFLKTVYPDRKLNALYGGSHGQT